MRKFSWKRKFTFFPLVNAIVWLCLVVRSNNTKSSCIWLNDLWHKVFCKEVLFSWLAKYTLPVLDLQLPKHILHFLTCSELFGFFSHQNCMSSKKGNCTLTRNCKHAVNISTYSLICLFLGRPTAIFGWASCQYGQPEVFSRGGLKEAPMHGNED